MPATRRMMNAVVKRVMEAKILQFPNLKYIAVVGAAVSVTLDANGVCRSARVAIGAVAPTALLVPEAAKALVGSSLDAASLKRAAEAASTAARPIGDKRGTAGYRRTVAGVLTRRAAAMAAGRARRK